MEIVNTENLRETVAEAISSRPYYHVFTVADTTTARLCLPLLGLDGTESIVIDAGEGNKNVQTLQHVWQTLTEKNASRSSLIINVGGGVVSDLGGFAAATFKRGIDYVNVPTTLMAMVDASVGGKTGINLGGLKNEIGAFHTPVRTIIYAPFLSTLDDSAILSGLAEMLKHSLLSGRRHWSAIMKFRLSDARQQSLQLPIAENIKIKQNFTDKDPFDTGIRQVLNFGHTFGHAVESWSLGAGRQPLPHGYAVAQGLVCALYLSCVRCNFPQDTLRQTVRFINDNYGKTAVGCNDYDEIVRLMHHDKKNRNGEVSMVLLSDFGKFHLSQHVSDDEIRETLDFLREG